MESPAKFEKRSGPKFSRLTAGNWITAIGSLVALVAFFLPWVTQRSIIAYVTTGLGLAAGGVSKASGLPLQVFFITLLAAVASLLLCLAYLRTKRTMLVPVAQVVLAFLGLLPFFLLPSELSTWSGGQIVIGLGLPLTVLGLLGVLVGGILSAADTRWR